MITDTLQQLALVYAAYLVTIASPGPSTMAIMGTAMRRGRGPALALALGVVTGSMIWALLAATGIATLLAAWAEALVVIRIAGGLYLLWLGWKAARACLGTEPAQAGAAAAGAGGRAAFWRRGVLLHLTNPKAILGWVAILSIGVPPDAPAHVLPVLIAGCACLGLGVNLGYALAFSTAAAGRAYRAARRWIEGALALLFGYAGLRLLLVRV